MLVFLQLNNSFFVRPSPISFWFSAVCLNIIKCSYLRCEESGICHIPQILYQLQQLYCTGSASSKCSGLQIWENTTVAKRNSPTRICQKWQKFKTPRNVQCAVVSKYGRTHLQTFPKKRFGYICKNKSQLEKYLQNFSIYHIIEKNIQNFFWIRAKTLISFSHYA